MAVYILGDCKICKKFRPLKDDICLNCYKAQKELKPPKFIDELFKKHFNI